MFLRFITFTSFSSVLDTSVNRLVKKNHLFSDKLSLHFMLMLLHKEGQNDVSQHGYEYGVVTCIE